jgi:hypothetical protein
MLRVKAPVRFCFFPTGPLAGEDWVGGQLTGNRS